MNYIREMNAFYDWVRSNPLTSAANTLWHALMHINNRTGWRNTFAAARSEIQAFSGLGRTAYYSARELLLEKGLITYKERGTQATMFTIIPFCCSEYGIREDTKVGNNKSSSKNLKKFVVGHVTLKPGIGSDSISNSSHNRSSQMKPSSSLNKPSLSQNKPSDKHDLSQNTSKLAENTAQNVTIPKHIKTKQIVYQIYVNVITYYEAHFDWLQPNRMEELMKWVDALGERFVLDAMEQAVSQQQPWSYAERLLVEFHNRDSALPQKELIVNG
ncbi:hypothetical protein [Heyndrickxia vini]|uniref:Uncharacterized protein n=1 Tax=Heyndrickxia vini TaxID=1476025 RepID=A0ABX7E431_9BACI|nr:hypothetical protein [Heyndrickxia vini]QQZ10039.1 hypothetical protein I5776_03470 [Heyndrickxia vini]